MKKLILIVLSFLCVITYLLISAKVKTVPVRPVAMKVPKEISLHGDARIDSYFWLREKQDPNVIRYLEAWNQYSDLVMKPTCNLQEALYNEMLQMSEPVTDGPSFIVGNYAYYERYEEGCELSFICRKKIGGERSEVLLDQNQMAKNHTHFKLMQYTPSPDGKYVAYAIDTVGTQYSTIIIQNCKTGEFICEEEIDVADCTVIWSEDASGFWYVGVDRSFREDRVLFHRMGTSKEDDQVVFFENDPLYVVDIHSSSDERFIFINSTSKDTSYTLYGSRHEPNTPLKPIQAKMEGLQYRVSARHNEFFIKAKEGENNSGLWKAPIATPSQDHWQAVLPASEELQITDFLILKNYLVIALLEEGNTVIEVMDLETMEKKSVPFPEPIYFAAFDSYQNGQSNLLRLGFSSLITPTALLEVNLETLEMQCLHQEKNKKLDPKNYEVKRIYSPSSDGTLIPITLLYKKGLQLDGKEKAPLPLLLNAYGAYEGIEQCDYKPYLYSLVDRGMVYAWAHVRGGGELGRKGYEEGRLLNKKNSFTDFICCAEHLIKLGYTSSERLAIEGRSAGGLLVSAVMIMRPDLFKVVVAEVPFVDVLNSMADLDMPYSIQEWLEWGNSHDREQYFYMKSYSPYDNVIATKYPALLLTAGFHDAQVSYWEPAKFAAKLSELKTDSHPLLFKTNMNGGHTSACGRYSQLRERAYKYAFVLNEVGIIPKQPQESEFRLSQSLGIQR